MNQKLRTLIAEMLDLSPEEVKEEMRRDQVPAWDSMTHLRLITAAEEAFGVQLGMSEITGVQTPGELAQVLTAHGARDV